MAHLASRGISGRGAVSNGTNALRATASAPQQYQALKILRLTGGGLAHLAGGAQGHFDERHDKRRHEVRWEALF